MLLLFKLCSACNDGVSFRFGEDKDRCMHSMNIFSDSELICNLKLAWPSSVKAKLFIIPSPTPLILHRAHVTSELQIMAYVSKIDLQLLLSVTFSVVISEACDISDYYSGALGGCGMFL